MSEQAPETPTPDAPEASQEPDSQPEPQAQEGNAPSDDTAAQEGQQSSTDEWEPDRAKKKIRELISEKKAIAERARKAEEKAAGVDELQTQTQTLASENLRLKVGYELGLPYNLAVRLQGSSREELLTDAEALVELVAPTRAAPTTARPVEQLKPGASPSDIEPAPQDTYPADFLPRRMRDRLAGNPTT